MISAKRRLDFDTPVRKRKKSALVVALPQEIVERIIKYAVWDVVEGAAFDDGGRGAHNLTLNRDFMKRFYGLFAMYSDPFVGSPPNKLLFYYTRAKIWEVITRDITWLGLDIGVHSPVTKEVAATPCFRERIRTIWCFQVPPYVFYDLMALPNVRSMHLPHDDFLQHIVALLVSEGKPARMMKVDYICFLGDGGGRHAFINDDDIEYAWLYDPGWWSYRFPLLKDVVLNGVVSISRLWHWCPGIAAWTFPQVHTEILRRLQDGESIWRMEEPVGIMTIKNKRNFMRYLLREDKETFLEVSRAILERR